MSKMSRWIAGVISIVILGATLAPVIQNFREEPQDSFPLSYYPMFSKKRSSTRRVSYLVGLDAKGNRRVLHYRYAGVGGMNQVRKQIRKQVREDKAEELCAEVAERVARSSRKSLAGIVTVQIVTGRYRMDDYFRGNKAPLSETVEASRAVERATK